MMYTLDAKPEHSSITLGELREFVNNELSNLPDDTCIEMLTINGSYPIEQILADEESIELYSFNDVEI